MSIANNKIEFDARDESPMKLEMTDFIKREVPNPMDTPQTNLRANQGEVKSPSEKFQPVNQILSPTNPMNKPNVKMAAQVP